MVNALLSNAGAYMIWPLLRISISKAPLKLHTQYIVAVTGRGIWISSMVYRGTEAQRYREVLARPLLRADEWLRMAVDRGNTTVAICISSYWRDNDFTGISLSIQGFNEE